MKQQGVTSEVLDLVPVMEGSRSGPSGAWNSTPHPHLEMGLKAFQSGWESLCPLALTDY